MVDDLLAQFRKSAPPTTGGPQPPMQEEYVAFVAKDKSHFLEIRRVRPPHHSPRSNLLLNVAHDGAYGTNFLVTYTIMSVLVRGRNLQEIVFAIQNQMGGFIQEFDPERWAKPTSDKAAFIESIEIQWHGNRGENSGSEQEIKH